MPKNKFLIARVLLRVLVEFSRLNDFIELVARFITTTIDKNVINLISK